MSQSIQFVGDDASILLPTDLHRVGKRGRVRATYSDGARDEYPSLWDFLEAHRIDLDSQAPATLAGLAEFMGEDWQPTHVLEMRAAGTSSDEEPDYIAVVMFKPEERRFVNASGHAYTLRDYLMAEEPSWTVSDGRWLHEGNPYPGGGNGTVTVRTLGDVDPRVPLGGASAADRMAVERVVTKAGDFAHGGFPESAAWQWIARGFDAPAVEAWLAARTFDPDAARKLRDAGVTPQQASKVVPTGRAAYKGTIGYALSNEDLRLEEALEFVRGTARNDASEVRDFALLILPNDGELSWQRLDSYERGTEGDLTRAEMDRIAPGWRSRLKGKAAEQLAVTFAKYLGARDGDTVELRVQHEGAQFVGGSEIEVEAKVRLSGIGAGSAANAPRASKPTRKVTVLIDPDNDTVLWGAAEGGGAASSRKATADAVRAIAAGTDSGRITDSVRARADALSAVVLEWPRDRPLPQGDDDLALTLAREALRA